MILNLSAHQVHTMAVFGGYVGIVTNQRKLVFCSDKEQPFKSQKEARQCAANWLIENKRIAIQKANLKP